jgi:hypothetical protein
MKTARMKCASYVNGVLEKDDYISQLHAAEYIQSKENLKTSVKNIAESIRKALSDKYKSKTAYKRTWEKITGN